MSNKSYTGEVKWFDSQKGYGFILREDSQDLFCHYSAIEMEGFKKLQQGDEVSYEITQGQNGEQAANVKILNQAVPVRKRRTAEDDTVTDG